MNNSVSSYRKAMRIAVVAALAVFCLAAPLSADNSLRGKGRQSASSAADTSSSAILTFSPGIASTTVGTSAQFNLPIGIARDTQGNLFVADSANSVIRKITTDGTVSIVAGNSTQGYSGDGGAATSAQLAFPTAVALDSDGNLYIADYFNNCVRKVDSDGIISTLATAPGVSVRGVAADAAGNVYFSSGYEGVWKANSKGVMTKIAGTGTPGFSGDGGLATEAQTSGIAGVTLDRSGNLYFAEVTNSDIRKVDTDGIITTVAGNQQFGYSGDGGPATSAMLNAPWDVRVDGGGNLYISDSTNNRIRKVNAAGTISTIVGDGNYGYAGDGGLASAAEFAGPTAVALDDSGNIFIADIGNNVIRKVQTNATALDFGTVTVSQTGGPIQVTVSNAGSSNLNVGNIVASSNFGVQTTCSSTTPLAPGSDCSVNISFTPTVKGNITGTATFSDDGVGNPHVIALQGQGVPHADKLVFATQFPSRSLNGNLGTVIVNATDTSNSLATAFTGSVALQIQGPAGFTTFGTQANATGGVATFNLSAVTLNAAGSYTIQASSAGLTSAQASFAVTGNQDFAIALSKQSLQVGTQSGGSLNVTVSPSNGFTGSIALSCSGLPANSTCSFAPVTMQANGNNNALPSVLTIATGVTTTAKLETADGPIFLATTGVFSTGLLGLVFAPIARRKDASRNKRAKLFQLILVAIILCGGLVGCGTLGGQAHTTTTPAGSYTVVVKATSAGTSHSSSFTLVVQ